MAENKTPDKKRIHPKEQFKGLEAKLNRLQKNPEKNAEEIVRLQTEAMRLLELIDRLERDELAKMNVADPAEAAEVQAELTPIVDEAAEIQRQLAELDTEKAEIAEKISSVREHLREERRVAICDELTAQWEAKHGSRYKNLSAAKIEANKSHALRMGTESDGQELTEDFSEFYFDHRGRGRNSVPAQAERILLERFPEYRQAEEPKPPVQEPTPSPVVTIDKVTEEPTSAEASVVEEEQPTAQPTPTPDKPKRTRKPKNTEPAPAQEDQTPKPDIDQESWLTQEVESFIAEFGLEEFLPTDFRKLKQEQQLKTIQDLKHRIVDIVKQDAKAHYNEAVGGEKARANIFGKLAIGVREAFKKETNIKNAERNEFEKIKGTDEGRKLVAEQMKLLAEINGGQEIVVGADGKLLIDYSEQLGIGTGSGQLELRSEYNHAANAFRSIPYEWGLAKEGSREKMAYEDAKAAYDTAVEKVLEVKKFAPGQEAKAIKDMMEIKNSLMLEQFLNTHPDIEIELGKLEQGAGKEQIKETILRLAGIQNSEKAALFAAGYGARVITKATLGAMAAPIVGAVFGYLRAKSRAKETLIEKGKEARYGGVDNGPGVMNVASTEFKDSKGREAGLHYKLEALIQEIEQKQSRNEDCTNLIARLNSRIMYTRNKIDAGLVNFGGQKEVLKNQYLLLDALNRAIVLVSAAELNVKKEVDKRLESILAIRSKRMSKEYIEDQAVLGAVRGAGIATAGYIVRAIGEEIGLWGVQETTSRPYAEEQPDSKPLADSGYMGEKSVAETQDTLIVNSDKVAAAREYLAQAEDHYQKAQEYYDAVDDVEKKNFLPGLQHAKAELDFQRKFLEDTERGINPPTENPVASGETAAPKDTSTASIADKGVKAPEDNVGGDNKSGGGPAEEKTEKPKVNERPVKSVKQDTGSVEAKPRNIPSAPEVKDLPAGLDAKAVVGEGGGITFAFKQQLEGNDELAEALKKQIGFTGKIGTKAFYEALGKEFGYIKENGEWIGVDKGNVAAYQFVKGANGYEVQEYHLVGKDWKLIETHNSDGQTFEGKDYEKEYEYLNTPKRKPELASGDGEENPQFKEPDDVDTNNAVYKAQFAEPEKPNLSNNSVYKAQFAEPDKEIAKTKLGKPEDDMRIRTRKVVREETAPPPENSRTVILESDKQDVKWTIEPGPPDGRPWIVEDFKLVGGKSLRMFADRYGYEDLNTSQVDFVGQRYRFNLNKIFARSEDWTDKWSKEPATRLLRVNVGDNVSGNKEKLANYVQMLYDEVKATGKTMKPFNDGFVGNKETTKDYILRMLFELEKRGKLDAFNDKFDNFMKGHGGLGSGDNTPEIPDTENTVKFNPAKTEMYELWEKYKKQPESLSEEEYTFAEKVEGLRKKLGSNFSSIQTGETAEHYTKRLESKISSVKKLDTEQSTGNKIEIPKTQKAKPDLEYKKENIEPQKLESGNELVYQNPNYPKLTETQQSKAYTAFIETTRKYFPIESSGDNTSLSKIGANQISEKWVEGVSQLSANKVLEGDAKTIQTIGNSAFVDYLKQLARDTGKLPIKEEGEDDETIDSYLRRLLEWAESQKR